MNEGNKVRLTLLALIYILENIQGIPLRIENWVRVRILKSHTKLKISGTIKSFDLVAIFVIFPGTSPTQSLQRIISTLKRASYSVILVVNENQDYPEAFTHTWSRDCLILSRKNIGADFGGYKAAIEHLENTGNYKKIKSLALINDSIYVSPTSQETLFNMLIQKSSTNCIFLHRQAIEHAASMFLLFKEEIVQSSLFRNFWKSYFPYSTKRKIVRKGEHELSKILGKNVFKPYVNLESIQSVKNKIFLPSEVNQVIEWSGRTSTSAEKFIRANLTNKSYSEVYSYSVFNLQVSNALGLYVNRVLNVPLKMDLVKLGLITISEFLERASQSGASKAEVTELRLILEKRGSHLTVSRLRSVLRP